MEIPSMIYSTMMKAYFHSFFYALDHCVGFFAESAALNEKRAEEQQRTPPPSSTPFHGKNAMTSEKLRRTMEGQEPIDDELGAENIDLIPEDILVPQEPEPTKKKEVRKSIPRTGKYKKFVKEFGALGPETSPLSADSTTDSVKFSPLQNMNSDDRVILIAKAPDLDEFKKLNIIPDYLDKEDIEMLNSRSEEERIYLSWMSLKSHLKGQLSRGSVGSALRVKQIPDEATLKAVKGYVLQEGKPKPTCKVCLEEECEKYGKTG